MHPIFDIESYKLEQHVQYENIDACCFYLSFRKPLFDDDHRMIMYGIEDIISKIFRDPITLQDIEEFDLFLSTHKTSDKQFHWPKELFKRVVKDYNGFLPITIKTIPSGTIFYPRTPVVQVYSEDMPELVYWVETHLVRLWPYVNTTTFLAYSKNVIKEYFNTSVDIQNHGNLRRKIHYISPRSSSSSEDNLITGVSHLLLFEGSDNTNACYKAFRLNNNKQIGYSNAGLSHSSIHLNDIDISEVKEGTVPTHASSEKDFIANIASVQSNIRPIPAFDSFKNTLDGLIRNNKFSFNQKGFMVLDNKIFIDDTETLDYIRMVLDHCMSRMVSAESITFGMAGEFMKHSRSHTSCSYKLSYAKKQGKDIFISTNREKEYKNSLPGKFSLSSDGIVYPEGTIDNDVFYTVYHNGVLNMSAPVFSAIKKQIEKNLANTPTKKKIISNEFEHFCQNISKT